MVMRRGDLTLCYVQRESVANRCWPAAPLLRLSLPCHGSSASVDCFHQSTHSSLPLPSGQYHRRRATVACPAFFGFHPPEAAKQGKRFLGLSTGYDQSKHPPMGDLVRAVLTSEAGSVCRSTVKAEGRRDLDIQQTSLRNMRRSSRDGHPSECGR